MTGVRRLLMMILAAGIVLLSGCFHDSMGLREDQTKSMSIAISADAPQSVREAANEFINRAAYYSDGELQITLSESQDMDKTLSSGEAGFAFVQNETLSKTFEQLKTLQLPYFFKNEDYHYSALNSDRTLHYLNKIIGEKYPMQILGASLSGYEDFAADASADLSNFKIQHPAAVKEILFSEKLQPQLSVKAVKSDDPFGDLLAGKVELAGTDLERLIQAAQTKPERFVTIREPWQIKTVYLMVREDVMENLSKKQQASIQQAVVMANGYCRTLTEQKREQELEHLEQLGVHIYSINVERYFPMMGDIYQYETEGLTCVPDPELDRLIRSDGAGETF